MCWPFLVKYSIIKNYGGNMIPFARMMTYGNKTKGLSITKIRSWSQSWLMLTSDNKLYAKGYGSFGGGKDYYVWWDTWTLIQSDVRNFWCDENNHTIYYQMLDNKMYWCGKTYYRGAGNNVSLSFVEDTMFSSMIIKKIVFNVNGSTVALSTTGNCYLIGALRQWTGVNTSRTTWGLQASSIYDVCTSGLNWFTVGNNGVVNGGGSNSFNILNTSGDTSTYYAYPINIGTSKVFPEEPMLNCNTFSVRFRNAAGAMVGRGSGSYGCFGNGNTNNLTSTTVISTSWPNYSSMIRMNDFGPSDSNGGVAKSYYFTNSTLYFFGSVRYGGGSTSSSDVLSPESLSIGFDPSKIIYIQVAFFTVYIYTSDGKVYHTGLHYNSPSSNTTIIQFTELTGSFYGNLPLELTRDSML